MPKVQVVHLTSPLCHWSWGYEPIVNRLRMRYGKQIDIIVGQALPYTDRAQWLKDYEMNAEEAIQWARDDILPRIGMPVLLPSSWDGMPESTLPPAIAAKCAGIVHGPDAERHLSRALMHAAFVEGLDTSQDKVIADVVDALGLDNDRMAEVAGTEAPGNALGEDAARCGHGANFYSLLVRDPKTDTVVTLPHAYDAKRVEDAVAYLSGGKAKPKPLKADVVAYAKENGPVPLIEFQKVFALPAPKAKTLVAKAEKAGKLERVTYRGVKAPFWKVA